MTTKKEQIAETCADAIHETICEGHPNVLTDNQYERIKAQCGEAIEEAVAHLITEMESFAE